MAVMGTVTAIAVRGNRTAPVHTGQLPELHLHLAQLIQLILQAVRFLGKLQKLLLLDIVHLLQPLNLRRFISQGITAVGGIAKGTCQKHRTYRQ